MRSLLASAVLLSACGAVEHARLHADYPITDAAQLSPPVIDPVVRDCARAVHVRGLIPGALVRVWSNDFEEIGRAAPDFGDADIPLTRALDVEDILTVSQTVNGIESAQSPVPVLVESWPDTPRAPRITEAVWECGRVVRLEGLEDACRVELFEDGSTRGVRWSPHRARGVVANTEIRAGAELTAIQYACSLDVEEGGKREWSPSEASDPVTAGRLGRDELPAPAVDPTSLWPGSGALRIAGLYVGARVSVFVNGTVAGEGLATNTTSRFALTAPLQGGDSVTAEQELCERSPASDAVLVAGELPPPELIGPVCNDDASVSVRHAALGATVVLKQGDRVVGTGGGQEGLSTVGVSGLLPGIPIHAVQYHPGQPVSDPSDELRVCCCGEGCNADLDAMAKDDPETWDAWRPASCKRSRNQLFDVKDHDPLAIELTADWAALNGLGSEPTEGRVQAASLEVAATLTAEEGPRTADCEFRPLSIEFDRLQSGNAFDGHRRLHLVTHCGTGDPELDRRRLLMEYTLYDAFSRLDGAALAVRLAEVVYRDPDGSEVHRALGFFRERDHEACERCGGVRAVELLGERVPDPSTKFTSELLDRFVSGVGTDTPAISCVDAAEGAFFLPWDHDPADLLADDPDWPHRVHAFDTFLGAAIPPISSRIAAYHVAQADPAMREAIHESPLDPIGRERLLAWYDLYMKSLKCFLGFK